MTTPTEAVAAAAAALDAHATPDYEAAEPGVGGPLLAADLDPTARRTKKARPAGGGGEEGGGGAGTGAPGGGGPGAPRPDGVAALSEGGLPGGPEGDADDMVRVVPVPKDSVLLREDVWRPVRLCHLDKASQLTLSPDRLEVSGTGGYASSRASHGAAAGCFYWECTLLTLGPSGGVRLGWSTRRAELQAPVGYDAHGFGLRTGSGEKVHAARRRPYAAACAKPGCVIGVYIYLPPGGRPLERGRGDVVMWKGEPYLVDRPEAPARPLVGAAIGFSINGDFQGIAYENIPEGTYYPTISLFTLPGQAPGAKVRVNFGPAFTHPPPVAGPGVEVGWCGAAVDGGPRMPRPRAASELAGEKGEKGGDKGSERGKGGGGWSGGGGK